MPLCVVHSLAEVEESQDVGGGNADEDMDDATVQLYYNALMCDYPLLDQEPTSPLVPDEGDDPYMCSSPLTKSMLHSPQATEATLPQA